MKFVMVALIVGALFAAFKMLMGNKDEAPRRGSGRERQRGDSSRSRAAASTGGRALAPPPSSAAGGKVNWLIGMGGDVAGKRYHVGQRNITLGRAPTNYIQTTDDKASRQHCQIRAEADGVRVTDMASSNGTVINGQGIHTELLRDGDTLEIGAATFVFRRVVDFASDDGMARKEIGGAMNEATNSAQSLQAVIAEALEGTGGDVDKAAEVLGIDADFIRTVSKMQD